MALIVYINIYFISIPARIQKYSTVHQNAFSKTVCIEHNKFNTARSVLNK